MQIERIFFLQCYSFSLLKVFTPWKQKQLRQLADQLLLFLYGVGLLVPILLKFQFHNNIADPRCDFRIASGESSRLISRRRSERSRAGARGASCSTHIAPPFDSRRNARRRIAHPCSPRGNKNSSASWRISYFCFFTGSGCWESNPVYMHPKHAYYRYTTARRIYC